MSALSIVERLREFDDFICGKGPLDGLHFGETKKLYGRQAMFWWRRSSPIDEAADTIDAVLEALREIEAVTARKQLPITAQINQIAIDALTAAIAKAKASPISGEEV